MFAVTEIPYLYEYASRKFTKLIHIFVVKMLHRPVRRSSGQDFSPLLRICHAVNRLLRVLTFSNS